MLLSWSLAQASYPFSRQQVQVTSCSWETIGYGPSARHSWGKKTLAVWTPVLLCQLASRSESGRGHSLYNNKEICCYVSVTHLNRLRDLFLKHGFLYIRSLQWRKNFQWLKHQKKKKLNLFKIKINLFTLVLSLSSPSALCVGHSIKELYVKIDLIINGKTVLTYSETLCEPGHSKLIFCGKQKGGKLGSRFDGYWILQVGCTCCALEHTNTS